MAGSFRLHFGSTTMDHPGIPPHCTTRKTSQTKSAALFRQSRIVTHLAQTHIRIDFHLRRAEIAASFRWVRLF